MTFQALQTREVDGGYQNDLIERELSELGSGGVLVRVQWSSLNYKDALSATGNKGVTRHFPHTPGIDAVGVVEEAGDGPFSQGDAVICTGYDLGMNTDGGFAEYIRVPAEWLVPLPEGLSARDAMVLGTAGLTAALCVESLLDTGVNPDQGPVLVTGATGGVGSVSVAILSKLGFNVAAVSGKADAVDWLKGLGAAQVISRDEYLENAGKPMLKEQWAGAIDCVGGDALTTALKSVKYGGSVAACGLAGSPDLNMTVFPFILRSVNLLGVDSVELPVEIKQQMWQLLADEWIPRDMAQLEAAEIGLDEVNDWVAKILKGGVRGRVVVRLP
ncbi:MAG: YhdH/YhfP family quinone oxidoreductase [Pseudomonadota bacterium]|uniref:YhdH/YhfP family quinone oxidoreductase n=1 Tax=Alcanivorax sp. TaxID=1872427 RepID=UPI0025BC0B1A|nr:YhdH/YhfP family quinone oxidoreductase [Alcanivorax sp.]MED5239866.1 YhdH/YhfP family quinone oxidoreductase [Pseudomonadota bacterium]MEE3321159.1 YhdH/YhfP family quinone oxidoreductase [Pseudomonadota bacterium]